MHRACKVLASMISFVWLSTAALYDVSVGMASNYSSWGTGWDSVYVLSNNLITLAAVPKIGGRVMVFNLGSFISLYVDSTNKGAVPTSDILLGGYRTLVSPQSSFPWPPSPFLDWKPYSCTIITNTADSCSLYLQSQIETTPGYPTLDGLRYERTITMYNASSHVRVLATLVNKGTSALDTPHGIWDDAECVCKTGNLPDTADMWVYFPLNPGSTMGKGRGYAQLQGTDTTQWKRNIAPGIMGVQYKKKSGKMGADSKAGWICYVNRFDGHAYVKKFTYVPGQTYPDSGSSVEVYTDPTNPFLEDEVMSPLAKALAPNDSIQFVEDWYSARTFGPVLSVGNAGLITRTLAAVQSHDTVKAAGVYGVFYQGRVKSVFRNSSGAVIAVADSHSVSPVDSFVYRDTVVVPANAATLALALYTAQGTLAGYLDSVTLAPTAISRGSSADRMPTPSGAVTISVGTDALSVRVPWTGSYAIEMLRLDGRCIAAAGGAGPGYYSISRTALRAGVYLVRVSGRSSTETLKCLLR